MAFQICISKVVTSLGSRHRVNILRSAEALSCVGKIWLEFSMAVG